MRLNYGAFSMSVNGEPTRVSHAFVKKNMVRYMRPHGRFAYWSCEKAAFTLKLSLAASASYCIFTLAVREPSVLASCIEIYYLLSLNDAETKDLHACVKKKKSILFCLFIIRVMYMNSFRGKEILIVINKL